MSGSLNMVTLIGNLGADPETRRLQSGDPVVSFRIATSESWKDKDSGERKERTDWHSIVVFNPHLCEVAEKYLKKGSKASVIGKLQTRKWQDQSGADRYSTEVVLPRFGGTLVLLDKVERPAPSPESYGTTRPRDTGSGYRRARDGVQYGGPAGPSTTAGMIDDDIPFAPEVRG